MMTKQMTYNDLENIKNSNLSLLQEAMRQAELRIQDENSRKERIDKRVIYCYRFL